MISAFRRSPSPRQTGTVVARIACIIRGSVPWPLSPLPRRRHGSRSIPLYSFRFWRPGARHRARHGRSRFRRQPQNPRRRFPQAHHDRGANRVLRGRLGMASAGNLKKVGRVGVKSLIYFEVMTTSRSSSARARLSSDPARHEYRPADARCRRSPTTPAPQKLKDKARRFLMNIIPIPPLTRFANDMLQVLLFAILFGAALRCSAREGRSA